MYDVVIVGARVAGSATGLHLARSGLKVLIVDQARFPSDTLSTHQLQVPGGARLARLGLLDKVIAAGTPAAARARFDTAAGKVEGRFPTVEGVSAVYSPRRTILDSLLVHAATSAGAEICEGSVVDEVTTDAGRVSGVRLTPKGGSARSIMARVVVGADGKNSTVARAVGAEPTRQEPARTLACYTYWSGIALDHGWMVSRPGTAIGAWPTNDGLVMTYVAQPASELDTYRRDPERAIDAALAATGELGELVLSGRRAERIRATVDPPNVVRCSSGPGWVLVGDAGLVMDPITGQGMGNALRDAELASAALVSGLGGGARLETALANYGSRRDRETKAMFDFTVAMTRLKPTSSAEEALFAAVSADPDESNLFFSILTGATAPSRLFSPGHLIRLLGLRGTARLMRSRQRADRDNDTRHEPAQTAATSADGEVIGAPD